MARQRKPRPPSEKTRPGERTRLLALALSAAGVLLAAVTVWVLRERGPGGTRTARPEDRPAIEAAEQFLNHWSRFEYGEALLISTGETRERVLLAMEKELGLSDSERETAQALREEVAGLRMELRIRSIKELGRGKKLLRVTAYAHQGGEVFERNQTFRVVDEDGWKVTHWDTGTHPRDKRR